jgi:hypothetical protein
MEVRKSVADFQPEDLLHPSVTVFDQIAFARLTTQQLHDAHDNAVAQALQLFEGEGQSMENRPSSPLR